MFENKNENCGQGRCCKKCDGMGCHRKKCKGKCEDFYSDAKEAQRELKKALREYFMAQKKLIDCVECKDIRCQRDTLKLMKCSLKMLEQAYCYQEGEICEFKNYIFCECHEG